MLLAEANSFLVMTSAVVVYLEVVLLYQQCDIQQQALLVKRPEARRHTPIVHLGQVHLHICPRHNTPGGMKESEVQEQVGGRRRGHVKKIRTDLSGHNTEPGYSGLDRT